MDVDGDTVDPLLRERCEMESDDGVPVTDIVESFVKEASVSVVEWDTVAVSEMFMFVHEVERVDRECVIENVSEIFLDFVAEVECRVLETVGPLLDTVFVWVCVHDGTLDLLMVGGDAVDEGVVSVSVVDGLPQ